MIFQTDKSGCATHTVNMTAFSLHKNMYGDTFEVTAEMEEYGTGMQTKSRLFINVARRIPDDLRSVC